MIILVFCRGTSLALGAWLNLSASIVGHFFTLRLFIGSHGIVSICLISGCGA
jgi:hypothetical protein